MSVGASPLEGVPAGGKRSAGNPSGGAGIEASGSTSEIISMSAKDRPYITCHELLDFLYLYLEDELPEDRKAEFERHLAVCQPCRDYIRQYQESILLGKAAFADPVAPTALDTPEALVQAILKTRQKP